jgi:hypothetical protein
MSPPAPKLGGSQRGSFKDDKRPAGSLKGSKFKKKSSKNLKEANGMDVEVMKCAGFWAIWLTIALLLIYFRAFYQEVSVAVE